MVDAVAATIAYLLADGDLYAATAGRVAGRHRFALADGAAGAARGWPTPAKALTVRHAGLDGAPDPIHCADAAQTRARVEARAWGESQVEAARVWAHLELACRRFQRTSLELPDGQAALIYVLWPVGDGPQGETDPETGIDYLRGTLRVWVLAQGLETA